MEKKKVGLGVILVIVLVIGGVIGASVMLKGKSDDKSDVIPSDNVDDERVEIKLDYNDVDYAFEFLKLEKRSENIVYSPLSIKYALNMLNEGANGETKAQIENVIGDSEFIKHNNIDKVLSLANAVYIRDDYERFVKEDYKERLIKKYNAEIKIDEFKDANNVNKWIEDKTMGQIKNMLGDKVVQNSDTQMLLINALALNMAWKEEFADKDTFGDTFYLDDESSMIATMMSRESKSDNVAYYKDKKVTVLTMDLKKYQDEEMEFMIIMPNEKLYNYVKNFRADDLEKIVNNLMLASKSKYGLKILVPKFSFDYDLDLKKNLKALGIKDAFDADLADFSNMSSSSTPLWVSEALHKANIDFSEEGVKAAAVTVMIMNESSSAIDENKPIEIKIDKPFMYLIKSKKSNEIWFVGTVYKPNLWEQDKEAYGY